MDRSLKRAGWGTALVVFAACANAKTDQPVVTTGADGKSTSPSGATAAARGKSLVRFVNAVPGAGLHLSADERTTFYDVDFKTVTPYTEIGDNLIKFRIRSGGADSVLAENTETMGDGIRYTAVAISTADGGIKLRVLRDELVPDSGKARIRVINGAPGLGDADVALAGQQDLLFDNIAYGTEAGYKDVAPSTTTLEIRGNDSPVPPVRLGKTPLLAGRAYSIVIAPGQPRGIQAIVFNDVVRAPRTALP